MANFLNHEVGGDYPPFDYAPVVRKMLIAGEEGSDDTATFSRNIPIQDRKGDPDHPRSHLTTG